MKGLKWKLPKWLLLLSFLLLSFSFSLSLSSKTSARTATSFGIRDWTSDNGNTWTTIGTPSDNGPNLGSTQRYFRGLRLVNYGAWGDGNYYAGHVVMNVTLKSGLGSGLRTNRVGTGSYDSAVSSNTYCALGSYGTTARSYSATNFRATYLGPSSGGTWNYDGWLVEWDFQGEMPSSYSGSYDAYCRIFPSSSNSEWFSFGTNSQTYIYIDSNTSLTVDVSTSQTDTLLQQQINQNNTMINQNNTIINQNNQQIEQDQQDREDLQDASDNAEDSADSSQTSAESTGTTLLAAFTAFVGALSNASPTNCNIDMDLGNLDLGIVNLCQLSPPPVFQTVASIFLILFFVPLSIATATKVINLFRSFQS